MFYYKYFSLIEYHSDFIGKSKEELDQEKAGRLKEFKKRKFDIGSALVASMRQRIKSNAKQVVGTHGEQN